MVARTHPATGLVVTLTRVGGEESPPSPIAGRVFVNLCAALLSPENESGGRHDRALGNRGANGSRDARGRRTEAGRRPAQGDPAQDRFRGRRRHPLLCHGPEKGAAVGPSLPASDATNNSIG